MLYVLSTEDSRYMKIAICWSEGKIWTTTLGFKLMQYYLLKIAGTQKWLSAEVKEKSELLLFWQFLLLPKDHPLLSILPIEDSKLIYVAYWNIWRLTCYQLKLETTGTYKILIKIQ